MSDKSESEKEQIKETTTTTTTTTTKSHHHHKEKKDVNNFVVHVCIHQINLFPCPLVVESFSVIGKISIFICILHYFYACQDVLVTTGFYFVKVVDVL